jgi:hydroxyethylthiazole kinase-like sugar kinase family protein
MAYARQLSARRDPIASTLQRIYERVRRHPQRIVFTEGEEEQVMRAAVSYVNQQLGTAILLGREDQIRETAKEAGHRSRPSRHRSDQRPRLAHGTASMPTISMSGCSAPATCSAIASADQQRPQPFRRRPWSRLAMPTAW